MRMVWIGVVTLVAALLATMPAGAAGLGPVQGGALPGPLPLFPPDNWWNVDVSGAPVDGGSAAFIAHINNGSQPSADRTGQPRRDYTAATSSNTRRKFPPSTFATSSRERPRASSAAPIVGQSP
jgi:hypothetical protein